MAYEVVIKSHGVRTVEGPFDSYADAERFVNCEIGEESLAVSIVEVSDEPHRVISSYNHDRAHNGWQFEVQVAATGATVHTSDAVYRSRGEAEHFGNVFVTALGDAIKNLDAIRDIDQHYVDTFDACPACAGDLVQLGVLGSRSHLQCRQCGNHVSRVATLRDGSLADLI